MRRLRSDLAVGHLGGEGALEWSTGNSEPQHGEGEGEIGNRGHQASLYARNARIRLIKSRLWRRDWQRQATRAGLLSGNSLDLDLEPRRLLEQLGASRNSNLGFGAGRSLTTRDTGSCTSLGRADLSTCRPVDFASAGPDSLQPSSHSSRITESPTTTPIMAPNMSLHSVIAVLILSTDTTADPRIFGA